MARILLTALIVCVVTSALPAGKLRGLWIDVFHEGIKNPIQVSQLIERAKRANANALFIQVRSRAQVYHVSAYEHRAPDTTPLFDGLAEAIKLAHAQNPPIQVHAWINAHPLWESKKDPPWADHVVLRHPEWLTKSIDGSTSTDVGRALDFGNPEAAEYLLRLYLEALRNYDVDGIHLDFIRYTGAEWGYNEVSVKRFFDSLKPEQKQAVLDRSNAVLAAGVTKAATAKAAAGLPATDDPYFSDWRRAQVTGFVRRLVYHAKALKPNVIVSAAVIPWGDAPSDFRQSAAYKRVFQDWKSWAEEGLLDIVMPMLYFREGQHGDWYRNWLEFCARIQSRSPIAAGIGNWLNTHEDTLKQARLGDEKLAGVCFFSYASTNPAAGQEAEVFNENFYTKIGVLGVAPPLGPNPKGLFRLPSTFGYRFDSDLKSPGANSGFEVREPSRRQAAVTTEAAASLGMLAVQVNRFIGRSVYRGVSQALMGDSQFTASDQVIHEQNGLELKLTDIAGRRPSLAVLQSLPDIPFLPGDVISLRGAFSGGKVLATGWRWLGVADYDKTHNKSPARLDKIGQF